MDQDKIPVAIQLRPGTGFLIAFKAAKYLFDNRLGWSDGRNPYAPRKFWHKLGVALYGENDERVIELSHNKPVPKKKPVRLSGKAYQKFRKQVWKRAYGFCENCGVYVPLLMPEGGFDKYYCGHVSHIKSRGAGGEDTLENVTWECFSCHSAKHGPRWERGKR